MTASSRSRVSSTALNGKCKKACGDTAPSVDENAAMANGNTVEFALGNHKLSIVSVDSSRTAPPASHSGELGRFELAGTTYVIVCRPMNLNTGETSPIELLSQRELQIAALVAEGKLNKQIADELRISEWTVCAHLRRIFLKLGVTTRAAMVYRCAGSVSRVSIRPTNVTDTT